MTAALSCWARSEAITQEGEGHAGGWQPEVGGRAWGGRTLSHLVQCQHARPLGSGQSASFIPSLVSVCQALGQLQGAQW